MEIFDIVDTAGNPTGQTIERGEAHARGIRHRTAHIWIVRRRDGRYQVLLQRRSMNKDSFPGLLDTSSAGHITAGDEPLPSALRELREELGICARESELRFIGTFDIEYQEPFHGHMFRDNEIAFVYIYAESVDETALTLQREEVDAVGWFDLDETIAACERHDPAYCLPHGGIMLVKQYLAQHSL